MNLLLSDYQNSASRIKCDPLVIQAVALTESSGKAFAPDPDKRLIIRFENHKFYQNWGKLNSVIFQENFTFNKSKPWTNHKFQLNGNWVSNHVSQINEWLAFELAKKFNEFAATKSISMGAFQIMGDNYAYCECTSPITMFYDMCESEQKQLDLFTTFIINYKNCANSLRNKNFLSFADDYNGPGQKEIYAEKILYNYRLLGGK